jgi:hypothetical protein
MMKLFGRCRSLAFLGCGLIASSGLVREAAAVEPARITEARIERVEGMPDAVAVTLSHSGGLVPERVRIYFDTTPTAGEASSGADLLVEGPSFYAYPAGARGWAWARIGAPLFQATEGRLVCVVSAPGLGRPFTWFVETTTADWNVGQRWPANGVVKVDPATLGTRAAPAGTMSVDVGPLLAARAVSLSVSLNGGPDLSGWTEVKTGAGFEMVAERLAALGLPAAARLQATLRDAAGSGEPAGLVPAKAWRRGDECAWAGETLGVAWVLVADSPREGELRLTGWLRDDEARVLRIEAGLALPLAGKTWADDMTASRVIDASESIYGHFAGGRYGLDARQSFYPIGVVEDGARAWVIETDPAEPRVFALGAGAAYLQADYDLALSPETKKFPGQATFRCSFYAVERGEEGGFRAALAEFFKRYPDYAERRVPRSGLWMPFSDISKLPGAEDFGFSFFEKVGERGDDVDYAKKNGVLTLMYAEPWLYWLPFNDGEERTPQRALEKMQQLAALGAGWSRDLAASGLAGASRDEKGDILTKFMDLPWNKGARMEVSSDPDLASVSPGGLNRAAAEWKRIAEWLDDPRVDGIYLDSMDAIVQPDHAVGALRAADYPATYTRAGRVPVMAPNVPQYEFTAALGALLRSRGKYLMANFPLVDAPFINRWIDIPGEETDWWSGGRYNPNSRERLDYRRALSGQKPFGFLQSTDFSTFEGEPLRRYFETCLFYGFQPSFFSHNAADNPYWHDPKLLERDRPLFRTFVPLARRVSDAGWQPVREARLAKGEGLRLEQFGRAAGGLWHVTLQNQTETRRTTELLLPAALGRVAWLDPQTGLGGWTEGGARLPVTLEPHATQVLDLVAPERLGDEQAFLRGWRSGAGEAAAALRSLESLRREQETGVRADIAPAGVVIAGEPSAWRLIVRNDRTDTISLRVPGGQGVPVPPGAERELKVVLPATETDTHVVGWSVVNADGTELAFVREVRVRPVAPIEAGGPGRRLLIRETRVNVPVKIVNHSSRKRECVVEWTGAGPASSGRNRVTLAAGAADSVNVPLMRPAGADAMTLTLKVSSEGRVWWTEECRVVFLDARASLASGPGVQVSADSTFGGYATKALNDGVADASNLAWNEGAWASEDAPVEHWVRLMFPDPVAVQEVLVHWHHEGGVTYTGREGMVLGEVATGQEVVIANWKSKPAEKATRVVFPRQMFKAIRVVQNPARGVPARPGIMWVSEIEVN